jgi:hypothetical protein
VDGAGLGTEGDRRYRPGRVAARFGEALRDGTMDHGSGSCLEDIRHVQAGHVGDVERGGALRCRPYWSVPAPPVDDGDGRDEESKACPSL